MRYRRLFCTHRSTIKLFCFLCVFTDDTLVATYDAALAPRSCLLDFLKINLKTWLVELKFFWCRGICKELSDQVPGVQSVQLKSYPNTEQMLAP
jgi:hypothetical protein